MLRAGDVWDSPFTTATPVGALAFWDQVEIARRLEDTLEGLGQLVLDASKLRRTWQELVVPAAGSCRH